MKTILLGVLGFLTLGSILSLVLIYKLKLLNDRDYTEMYLDSGTLVQKENPIRPIVCTVNLLSPIGDTLTWLSYDKPSYKDGGIAWFYDTSGIEMTCDYSWVTIKNKE